MSNHIESDEIKKYAIISEFKDENGEDQLEINCEGPLSFYR